MLLLEANSYPDIAAAMVRRKPEVPSAAVVFHGDHPPQDSVRMFTIGPSQIDVALGTQLESLINSSSEDLTPPEAYVFTANSAVPVADAIRGYYDVAERELPPLTHIVANKSFSRPRFFGGHGSDTDVRDSVANFKSEIVRLSETLAGLGHVCIVEQFVASGATLRYAHEILRKSGVEQVTAIRGRWYDGANPQEVDINELTSTHAPIMRQIGQQAALSKS